MEEKTRKSKFSTNTKDSPPKTPCAHPRWFISRETPPEAARLRTRKLRPSSLGDVSRALGGRTRAAHAPLVASALVSTAAGTAKRKVLAVSLEPILRGAPQDYEKEGPVSAHPPAARVGYNVFPSREAGAGRNRAPPPSPA